MIFDDSFEHEVSYELPTDAASRGAGKDAAAAGGGGGGGGGAGDRIVLLMRFWHPDINTRSAAGVAASESWCAPPPRKAMSIWAQPPPQQLSGRTGPTRVHCFGRREAVIEHAEAGVLTHLESRLPKLLPTPVRGPGLLFGTPDSVATR